jgi:hypothetical protein
LETQKGIAASARGGLETQKGIAASVADGCSIEGEGGSSEQNVGAGFIPARAYTQAMFRCFLY